MTKKPIPIIAAVLLLCTFLTGCPSSTEQEKAMNIGAFIMNYPDWARNDVTNTLYNAAFSQWDEWQSDISGSLRNLVPHHLAMKDSAGKNLPIRDYAGKYRLYINDMTVSLEFDNGKFLLLLYLWNKIADDNSFITVPQPDSSAFSYSPTAKYGYEGEIVGDAQCDLQFLKTEGHVDHFTYTLTIDGIVIVDRQLYAPRMQYYPQNVIHNWLPGLMYQDTSMERVKYREIRHDNRLVGYINKADWLILGGFPETMLLDRGELDEPNFLGGMKEISVDGAAKKAVYRLFDGAPGAPQYVELHRDTEATVQFTWFNLPEGQQDAAASRIDLHKETLYVQK